MAKKAAVKIVDESELATDEILTGEQLNPALARIYAENGYSGEVEAMVYVTIFEDDGGEARIFRGTPDDYDLEMLARKFGSGMYRVKVYVRIPTGQMVVKINQTTKIRLSPEDELRLRQSREMPPATPLQPQLTAEAIAAAFRASMPPPVPAPTIDFASMLKTVADTFKAIMPQPQAPQAQGISPLDMLKTVVSVVKEVRTERAINDDDDTPRRGASGNDIWIKLIDKFAPLFEQTLRAQGVGAPVNGVQNPMVEQPQLGQNPPMGQSPVDDPAIVQLKMGISFLIAQAAGGHDPVAYADVVMDNTPEESLDTLIDLPDPVAYLASIDARVNEYRAWFDSLFKEIKAAYAEDDVATAPAVDAIDNLLK